MLLALSVATLAGRIVKEVMFLSPKQGYTEVILIEFHQDMVEMYHSSLFISRKTAGDLKQFTLI